ncbi:hypothetical protein ACW95P_04720 [Candidatus Mycoplasma pogonae]
MLASYKSNDSESKNTEDLNILKSFYNDKTKILSYFKEKDYKKLSNEAKNNIEILNWIKKTNYKTKNSIVDDIKTLSELSISKDLKIFMLENLVTKFEMFQKYEKTKEINPTKTKSRWLKNYKERKERNYNNDYAFWNAEKRTGELYYYNNQIIQNGEDYQITWDHMFNDDVTHIGWSTEYIAKFRMTQIIKETIDDFTLIKNEIKPYLKNEVISDEEMLKYFANNKDDLIDVFKNEYQTYEKQKEILNKIDKNVNKRLLKNSDKLIRFQKKLSGTNFSSVKNAFGVKAKFSAAINSISKSPKIVATSLKHLATAFSGILSIVDGFLEYNSTLSEEKLIIKYGLGAIGVVAGVASLVGSAIPVLGALFVLGSIGIQLLENIKTNNGYTIWENFGDHGLNDWYFQLKNNSNVISQIAHSFSENFTKPIEWKVDDGWFTLPNLFIRTGQGNYKSNFIELSPGWEFNYGDKIKLKLK